MDFDSGTIRREELSEDEKLLLDLPNFGGPLDLLLELARAKKIDLTAISILEIADQFLAWLRRARDLRLELAADWLVMAATLALLKSRLLIPVPKEEREEAEAAVEDLAARLRRLDALRSISEELTERQTLGVHWFRPFSEEGSVGSIKRLDANLHALLVAYVRDARRTMTPAAAPVRQPFLVLSVEEAIRYLETSGVLGDDWKGLFSLIPPGRTVDKVHARSKIASAYVAALELGKRGLAEVQQDEDGIAISVRKVAS